MALASASFLLDDDPCLPGDDAAPWGATIERLEAWFGLRFALLDGTTGQVLHGIDEAPLVQEPLLRELVCAAAASGRPEFIADEDPLLLVTIPLTGLWNESWVALAPVVARPADRCPPAAAHLLGLDVESATQWLAAQPVWHPETLLRVAGMAQRAVALESQVSRLHNEVDKVSQNLASTYEEISLLFRLTQNLRISSSDRALGRMALEWLMEVVPAEAIVIRYDRAAETAKETPGDATDGALVLAGRCPLPREELERLVGWIVENAGKGALVMNHPATEGGQWPFPQLRQLVAVPLTEGTHTFGCLLALNHRDGREFGTVEANLLGSVAAILGIHGANIELYRQHAEMMTGIVRALTSAIDAKDPYTCGHSDRVARIAVRLAEELHCDGETLQRIYLAGLLHDIGKIGIDDNVLRKPGRLTEAEYEHIKLHPSLGHKILKDLRHLADVLPTVLHHHEQWDGSGYPAGLEGEEIPRAARIVAVADAFDAMTSDRPYREGMPYEKVDAIFAAGAGRQWDAEVVEAYFRARSDIRRIAFREREALSYDTQYVAVPEAVET